VNHARARLSALVDGELDHETRDRVLAHLTHCADCRTAADGERQVKAILSGMPEPAPSESFQSVLLGIGAPAPVGRGADRVSGAADGAPRATEGHGPTGPERTHLRSPSRAWRRRSGPWPGRPPGQRGSRRPGDSSAMATAAGRFPRRIAAGVAGLAAMAGMAVVGAFAAGGDLEPEVRVVPPVQRYSVEHADTVSDVPLSDPGAVTTVLERGLRGRSSDR
jgi:Putative zinc-finger